ncbi:RelA/SpoT domain-containing protein, partial [Vibrio parahaemolyticus]|uniref:RelA/SpoT domain-containing protein n=1 Tax=Vibrio parahaemolyticus TaxID=670 RepID=UPI002490E4BD
MTELKSFLEQHNLTQEDWDAANVSWEVLTEIAHDFDRRKNEFEQSALSIAAVLQKNKSVHSVRWRVKDCGHLRAKIVRKLSEGSEKYAGINASNYDEIITDLVGVRVLHLFKEEWKGIQEFVNDSWSVVEGPIVYYREGDKLEQFTDCEIKKHSDGYRSIHSIITTRLQKKEIKAELQVRTVFEEAWSEIDHRVRYPNYSSNETICYFLNIFNGLAGYADEMGTFVKKLAQEISAAEALEQVHEQLCKEHEQAERERTELISTLEELAGSNKELKNTIEKLKTNEDKIKIISDANSYTKASNKESCLDSASLVYLATQSAVNKIFHAKKNNPTFIKRQVAFPTSTTQELLNAIDNLAKVSPKDPKDPKDP